MFPSAFSMPVVNVLQPYFKINSFDDFEKLPVEHAGYLVEVKVPSSENLNSSPFSIATKYCGPPERIEASTNFQIPSIEFSLFNAVLSSLLVNPNNIIVIKRCF
jgi:hypothetical protein